MKNELVTDSEAIRWIRARVERNDPSRLATEFIRAHKITGDSEVSFMLRKSLVAQARRCARVAMALGPLSYD